MVYIVFVSISIPLIMLSFIMKGHSKKIIEFVVLGMVMAVASYEINSLIRGVYNLDDLTLRISIAPITEEIIKSVPLLFFIIWPSKNKRNIIDISMAVGIGFALLENTYFLLGNYRGAQISWALARGFATGLMHGISTAIIGYGMSFIYKKKLFYSGIIGLLCVSVTYHGIYNLLVESGHNYLGFLLPAVTYLIIILSVKQRNLYFDG